MADIAHVCDNEKPDTCTWPAFGLTKRHK